ncbi:MAG: molybdopterin molybdotransferase MoeA [Chloroflexi bacterium]|nr:molybdopterin molybdotransferase MoeA [Chloroflexota bacterium]
MISVEEARERILGFVRVLDFEVKPLLDCLGQVLAEDAYSTLDVPPSDSAAMDGFAVRADDIRGASPSSPRVLRVIGEVAAGRVPQHTVTSGTAVRIMTGAAVPPGADTVIRFEDTNEAAQKASSLSGALSHVSIFVEEARGINVRLAGEEIKKGELVVAKGAVLRPAEIGVLASLGKSKVRVVRRPLVAVLATGDELVDIDEPLPPGKIYNSNSYGLAALVRRYGGIPKVLGIARDTIPALTEKIGEGLDADMFLTSAGVSMGDYDVVKDVLASLGEVGFWTVRMKPGKPLAFGLLRAEAGRMVPLLGLPGFPVSSMVTFEQFARPAILKMLGKKNFDKPVVEAIFEGNIGNRDGRRVYARAAVTKRDGQYHAALSGPQGSGILTSMVRGNGLVVVPEDVTSLGKGDRVQVQMLDWEEDRE